MQKKNRKVEDKELGLQEPQEESSLEFNTQTTEEVKPKTKKKLEVRTKPGYGLFEIKYEGGGEQPAVFKGAVFTTKALALNTLADYLEGK